MDIKQQAIQRAISTLTALGVDFKVILADGQAFGNLEVAAPAPTRTRRANVYKDTGHIEKISALQVGEAVSLYPPEGEDLTRFQSACSGAAGRLFGTQNYMSSKNSGEYVEILRIA